MALLFVPTTEVHGPNLIVVAQEQAGGVFESVGSPFEIVSPKVEPVGNALRAFGKNLRKRAFKEALFGDFMNGSPEDDV
jgi:hypothetical protein